MTYAVMGEDKRTGAKRVICAGFPTKSSAEDFPIRLAEWNRVWVAAEHSERSRLERRRVEIEKEYDLILAAAVAGDRCPMTQPYGPISSSTVTTLIRQKRVRSEVFFHNWRVITILDGKHKGAKTAPPPDGSTIPYSIKG